ncbi:MAG: hypothetical protein CSA66_07725 [Proteobacteria bacterium]|nr:MAG: hypothetical protein CSA66_07725 [Pseudomonadota bacterium]
MARDDSKILKRFANLDIDGVQRPPRPKRRDPGAAAAAAAAPKRIRRGPAVPEGRRLAPEESPTPPWPDTPGAAPPPHRPNPRMTVTRSGWVGSPRRAPEQPAPRGVNPMRFEAPPGSVPGVITVEMDLRGSPQAAAARALPPIYNRLEPPPPTGGWDPAAHQAALAAAPPPGPRRAHNRPPPLRDSPQGPIELTEIAARQLRLMAWRHGVVGAALRVLSSGADGWDFAFEQEPEPGDVVLVSQGIRLFVDERTLETLRGTRITYQDLPGISGFRIG